MEYTLKETECYRGVMHAEPNDFTENIFSWKSQFLRENVPIFRLNMGFSLKFNLIELVTVAICLEQILKKGNIDYYLLMVLGLVKCFVFSSFPSSKKVFLYKVIFFLLNSNYVLQCQ